MDLDRLWKNVQEELKIILNPAVYQTFVTKTQLISLKDQIATVACSNSYLADFNRKRYYNLFKEALDNQTKANNIINFIIQEPVRVGDSDTPAPLLSFTPPPKINQSNLHPRYTFSNLIVGNSNNFAFAAAQGIIKNPGLSYNPFFIWGGVGVGKTHLMQAIGHELLSSNPSFKLRYFPAETFGNELIQSLKTKNINQFKDKYRNLDCILVDDIQFIAGKEYIQEEFFHTFNYLHLNGKQIILTSDRKPSDIKDLKDRLVSRFMGGLTVDIQLPDYEMRIAIINQRAEEKNIKLTPAAANLLAQNIVSNIRDIEGKLQQLSLQAQAGRVGEIDIDFIQKLSSSTTQLPSSKNLTPRHIISVCAKHFDIKTSDLCGNSRKKELTAARHVAAYLLLTQINLPLKEVGQHLGGRDHTSIMHARDKITAEINSNPTLRQTINQIQSLL